MAKKDAKKFTLKQGEVNYIAYLNAQHRNLVAAFLSWVSVDRLGYRVTKDTQFEFENEELRISEREPEKEDKKKSIVKTK